MNNRGLYIVVEGVNGSGKTTFTEGLSKHIQSSGCLVEVRSEPDRRSVLGRRVREWLEDSVVSPERLQECMTWARLAFMERLRKDLEDGINTIVERSWLSSVVYGMIDGCESASSIDNVNECSPFVICQKQKQIVGDDYIIPDLMILVDIEAKEADRRIAQRSTARRRFDHLDYITRARNLYLEIWAGRMFSQERILLPSRERWLKINGCSSMDTNVKIAASRILNILQNA